MDDQPWYVVGVSVQGAAHERAQVPCQDAHDYRVLPGGELILAVADGAGSARHADIAATLAAQQAVALIERALGKARPSDQGGWQQLIQQVFQDIFYRLEALAQHHATSLSAFATTLSCVIVADPWLAIGQIGDGLVVVEHSVGELTLPIAPQRGEYANETSFLLSLAATLQCETFVTHAPVRALAVSTDGLLRLAVNCTTYEPFAPFFQPLFAVVAEESAQLEEELIAWLESEPVCERTNDDKTLIVAIHNSSTSSESPGECGEGIYV